MGSVSWFVNDIYIFFSICRESGLRPMDAEQLRENGHKMVDFIADYYKSIENFPVLSQVEVIVLSSNILILIHGWITV